MHSVTSVGLSLPGSGVHLSYLLRPSLGDRTPLKQKLRRASRSSSRYVSCIHAGLHLPALPHGVKPEAHTPTPRAATASRQSVSGGEVGRHVPRAALSSAHT